MKSTPEGTLLGTCTPHSVSPQISSPQTRSCVVQECKRSRGSSRVKYSHRCTETGARKLVVQTVLWQTKRHMDAAKCTLRIQGHSRNQTCQVGGCTVGTFSWDREVGNDGASKESRLGVAGAGSSLRPPKVRLKNPMCDRCYKIRSRLVLRFRSVSECEQAQVDSLLHTKPATDDARKSNPTACVYRTMGQYMSRCAQCMHAHTDPTSHA